MEYILAIAHVLAATGVSIHVLLTHRHVRSSIGWIALSWLSPFIGSSVYVAFGINRVVRRALKSGLGPCICDPEGMMRAQNLLGDKFSEAVVSIGKAGDNISGMALTTGNSMKLFCNGEQAYPAMLEQIENAKHSIAMSSYIFASDNIGRRFSAALIGAKQRGVDVRVLVDGIGSGYFRSPVVEQLRDGGVNVEQFLHQWAPWAMTYINLRNHKKLLIVDGKIGFTGGMNISDENLGSSENLDSRKNLGGAEAKLKIKDIQAQIKGPAVAQLLQTFERDWEFTTSLTLKGDIWWPQIEPTGNALMRGIASGPDESIGQIESLFATAIEQAQKRIRIVTPYFLPEDRLFDVIRRAAMRGVAVEILVPQKSNHFYFNWAIAGHLATFSLQGIDCYLMPAPFDHSKLFTIDGQWSSIGSANWDARSMRLNFEFQVECYDKKTCSQIDALIDEKKAVSKLLAPKMIADRSVPIKLRDAGARLFLPYL